MKEVVLMRLAPFCSAVLVLLFAVTAASSGATVRERLNQEPRLPVYGVIFGVTVSDASTPAAVRIGKVVDPQSGTTDAVTVSVPPEYVVAAERMIRAKHYEPAIKDGKPTEFFTYFYYVPGHPGVVVTDLDKPLDEQP